MRKRFGGIGALVFLLLSTYLYAADFHPFSGWRTVTTQHFSIHYERSLEETAQKAAGYFEEAHAILSPKYQWKPWGHTQVILTDNFDDSNGLASTLPYNWILLRVGPPDPESPLAQNTDWLKMLITHEYTHILHIDAYGGFWKPWRRFLLGKIISPAALTPGWIREGAATLEETVNTDGGRGRSDYSEMLIRTAILTDQFPTIDRADGVHWKWPGRQTQYIFGVKFLQYLEGKYGEEKLIKFHKKTQRSLFMGAINGHARRIFGKRFADLWNDWQEELKEKYQKFGATEYTQLIPYLQGEDSLYLPTFSPDGRYFAYVTASPKHAPALWLKNLKTGEKEKLTEKIPGQITFSPDGRYLVFSAQGVFKRFYLYSDLYRIDLRAKKKVAKRITKGERARDPDYSPDGKQILYVVGDKGTDHLKIYDVATKKTVIFVGNVPPYTQFAHPRFSPDGRKVALVRFNPGVGWDLCLAASDGRLEKCITHNGIAVESRPVWTPDGRYVVYSSTEGGVPDLYAYDLRSDKTEKLTKVTTGLFQPALSSDGKQLLARHYHGRGYDIREVPFELPGGEAANKSRRKKGNDKRDRKKKGESLSLPPPVSKGSFKQYSVKKYNALTGSLFLPRYVLPGILALDNGLLLSGATGSFDPLRYHQWIGGATYRTDAKHVGYFGFYRYNRFLPQFGIGVNDSAVDYGVLRFSTGNSYHYYEEWRNLSGFVSIPIGTKQGFGFSYFYDNRSTITNILANEAAALSLGKFAGFSATYVFGQKEAYPASISPIEKGRRFKATFSVSDAVFGAGTDNEQRIFTGDYREYLPLGKNYVLALRASGGAALGDRIIPGTFTLGGALGEGTLAAGGSSRYFALRGLPISTLTRDRAMLMSAEFRIPLVSPQHGVGTAPLFLNNLHMGLFADYGDAWDSGDTTSRENFKDLFDDFLLGVGLEMRADFVIGHGLPLTGRLGYGIIVVNRARLGTLKDPFLNNSVKHGILILQWGTSF